MTLDVREYFAPWRSLERQLAYGMRVDPKQFAAALRKDSPLPELVTQHLISILEGTRPAGRPRCDPVALVRAVTSPMTAAKHDVRRFLAVIGRRRGTRRGLLEAALAWAAAKHGVPLDRLRVEHRRSRS